MTDSMPRGSVAGMDVDSISPVAQDYVKAIWSATEWGDPPITTKALAARFGTSAANVTDTMRRLAAQGLIDYQPYKPVQLTTTGTALAVTMVRRHRLIETFLVTTLGYRWDEIHDEAERLEHAATDLLINRIDTLLGHPTADPHGDPIPTADGRPRLIAGAVRLSSTGPGRHLIRRISDANPDNLHTADDLGISPGVIIETAGAGASLTISTLQGARAIPEAVAQATWTTPAP
jgi:DtxR family Mn-dependent transcriptional regulator